MHWFVPFDWEAKRVNLSYNRYVMTASSSVAFMKKLFYLRFAGTVKKLNEVKTLIVRS